MEIAHDLYWIGCWVGPRAGLEEVIKRKTSATDRNSTSVPWSSSHKPRDYTD
jgi:hypothetical protein